MNLSDSLTDIDNYIASFSKETQVLLIQMRTTIQKIAPEAQEAIKYGMPTYILKGNLVHFAGYEKHIGFYPTPSAMQTFKDKLSVYKTGKGSVQFPLDKPLPIDLISKIVAFRVMENKEKGQK
jgi:uncharacterized protein YdhG (YjbR/CyaY superfamily)